MLYLIVCSIRLPQSEGYFLCLLLVQTYLDDLSARVIWWVFVRPRRALWDISSAFVPTRIGRPRPAAAREARDLEARLEREHRVFGARLYRDLDGYSSDESTDSLPDLISAD